MAKEKFERTKPHVNIGTIGHVDHGNKLKRLFYWIKGGNSNGKGLFLSNLAFAIGIASFYSVK